jgi:hypothetical protein
MKDNISAYGVRTILMSSKEDTADFFFNEATKISQSPRSHRPLTTSQRTRERVWRIGSYSFVVTAVIGLAAYGYSMWQRHTQHAESSTQQDDKRRNLRQ